MPTKLAIIMRGLPGSGKSYWVEQFITSQGIEQAIHIRQHGLFSTDRYFYQQGQYRFNPQKIGQYHQTNLTAFIQALARKEPIVICDNTNIAKWEFMAYEAAAKALGYQVKVVLVGQPGNDQHQQLCVQRNQHQVSLVHIQKMAQLFEE
ncbi:ATP-binding protein [Shewanella sp. SG44-2]|uniref:AAA family ATPase n=1 Tax=Shewanella sp. SG44-2 TaxID=2760962 RepID=UPI0015FF8D37|nr:AAA family ATPase [Shewanella sp. SG44-2]MBB1427179.1 ATP-binding protein [Shewanella sp. SG44-2]